jgi:hypothetical protein
MTTGSQFGAILVGVQFVGVAKTSELKRRPHEIGRQEIEV